jgi:cytochrome c oxidase subunit 1
LGHSSLVVVAAVWNVFRGLRYGEPAGADDPWGFGNSLERATSCPPPRHDFTELPAIRSERPAFELHYPHMVERFREESRQHPRRGEGRLPAPSEVGAAATQPDDQDDSTDPRGK